MSGREDLRSWTGSYLPDWELKSSRLPPAGPSLQALLLKSSAAISFVMGGGGMP